MKYISEIGKLANRFLQLKLIEQLGIVLLAYMVVLGVNVLLTFYTFIAILGKIS